ncbi:hypothetical protein [Actinomadura sp. 9N215]|uniref:hypothetical protein n=1 Tax=Actinomadura sp. 9N215 TaxID=3375150 RepID=UPI0037B5955F
MSLQRSIGPFHRPYSPPEPPSPERRPKRFALFVGAAVLAVAAVAAFLVIPGRGGKDASVRPTPETSRSQVVRALPAPCGAVSKRTVDRTVPMAMRTENANSTLTTCTYSTTGSAFPWLRVETHLYASGNTATPVRDAENYYDTQWAQAHDTPLVRTISLERHRGLGDEAYRWLRADEGRPSVVGQVTARIRNAVFTVSYAERAPAGGVQDGRERASLAKVTAVAREVLTALNRF